MLKVCKFGGTSMSTAETIRMCADIVKSDDTRKYIVVSAPGKRSSSDIKITDMLYACYTDVVKDGGCDEKFAIIHDRFVDLVNDLGIDFDIEKVLNTLKEGIISAHSADYAASIGERVMAMIFAKVLGYEFVDAKDIIFFNKRGAFNEEYTNDMTRTRLYEIEHAVIPGFYGSMPNGEIKTFSRGGSDVTGAVIARAVSADIYENWTDVSGFLTADPRIIKNPRPINEVSYKELRELAYMGAAVLHPESIFPVSKANIPINIRNTFRPQDKGTMILPGVVEHERLVTGVSGKKNFTIIRIEKAMMNSEIGFVRKVLSVLEQYDISFEHLPSGIDTMCLVIADSELADKLQKVLNGIRETVHPDSLEVDCNIALVTAVGHGMSYRPGTAARLFAALSRVGVNIRMIDQGSSEMNIIVGIANDDYEKAINVIYDEFILG